MSIQTRPPRRGAPGTRDRLPRPGTAPSRGSEIGVGLLGVLGLVVLVIGIPVALAVFVGYPLPRSAPSQAWLTTTISATFIIKALACVVWVVWAHFVVCLLAEWRSIRRGRIPGHVALGGGSQFLARRLVAAALLLAGAATTFSQTVVPGHGIGAGPGRSATAVTSTARAGDAATPRIAATPETQPTKATEQQVKYYVVQPPHGRRYDSLWDIAQRTLHDPLRYKEIFALNKDRMQSDGRKLNDANLIMPGWQLHLPADASGPGVHATPVHTPAAAPAPAVRSSVTSPISDPSMPTAHAGAAEQSGSGADQLSIELLGGGLMLAGIALALTARRGPYAGAGDDERALTNAADLGLARSLDRALRNLAAARHEQGRELPQPVLAWAAADEVSLAFAGGDLDEPPMPWRAESDAIWSCALTELTDHPRLAETAAPFPGLLSVGRDGEREVFVDFEQAPGLISVGGDEERARDLVTSLAAQAVTCVWSDGARATLVGFSDGAQLAALDTQHVTHVSSLGDVLDDLEHQQADLERLQRSLGVDGVLHGRQTRRSGSWAPHFLVLSGPPSGDDAQRLRRLVGNGRSSFVALVVGNVPQAAWRFAIAGDRMLDLGVLGAGARAHQLDRNAMLQLIDVLREATATAAKQDAEVARLAPRAALARTLGPVTDPNDAGAALPVRAERPANGQVLASVSLLGPVTVDGPGRLDADKRELVTEIVVAVALAPNGIPDVVLRSAIWPRGVSDEVFGAAMRDAAEWLGTDHVGRPALRQADGRWLLGPSVAVDWENLQLAVQAAQGDGELDALRFCVSLFRGEGFSGVPAKRYGWLSFHRCARDAAVLATSVVRRATALLVAAGQPADAESVLRRGLTLVPTAEPLWRDLLELCGGRGPDSAAAVAHEMYAVLRARRVWTQPETDALVSQLAPGRAVTESA